MTFGNETMEPDLSIKGLVFDVDRFSLHDGPGIRTAVFLKGCPLRCLWCHSPESQLKEPEVLYQEERCIACWHCIERCQEKALRESGLQDHNVVELDRLKCISCGKCVEICYPEALRMAGSFISVGELLDEVRDDLPFYRNSGGGVTLSGGEPLMQPEFSYNFLLACAQDDIHTVLETSGYARWEVMSRLASVTNLFLYDIKLIDSNLHQRYTGVQNKLIMNNLAKLSSMGKEIQVRVPCIPGINDSVEHICSIVDLVSGLGIKSLTLLPYNSSAGAKYQLIGRSYTLSGLKTQTEEYMSYLAEVSSKECSKVRMGG